MKFRDRVLETVFKDFAVTPNAVKLSLAAYVILKSKRLERVSREI